MVEWGRLLSGYRGEILGRRFESCPPRHEKHARDGRVLFNQQRRAGLQPAKFIGSNNSQAAHSALRCTPDPHVSFTRDLITNESLFETQFHPQMRSLKSQPFIETMGIAAGLVSRQLDDMRAALFCPLH